MGKSLRSKPKLRAKSVKRKGEFSKFVEDRDARLAQKGLEHLQKQREEAAKAAQENGADAMTDDTNAAGSKADVVKADEAMTDAASTNAPAKKNKGKGKKKKGNKGSRNRKNFLF